MVVTTALVSVSVLLYLDLRIRTEGLDLELDAADAFAHGGDASPARLAARARCPDRTSPQQDPITSRAKAQRHPRPAPVPAAPPA